LKPAPLSHVWHFIKLQDFNKFWSALDKAEHSKGTSEETDVVKWNFKDGTVIEVKQEEHSTLNHYITYSVITASPALSYTSVVSTIRCYAVTSGENENSTFVQWTGNFSSDADAGMSWLLPILKPNANTHVQVSSRTPSSSAVRPSPTSPRPPSSCKERKQSLEAICSQEG
jgi:hypothetical protein